MSRRRSRSDSIPFDTFRLEGTIFVPELLERASRGEASHQSEADYRIPKGLKLHDEYGRAYRIATALWQDFALQLPRTDLDPAKATHGFVLDLLRQCLGYSDLTPLSEPVSLDGRGFPITARAVGGQLPVIIAPHDLGLDDPDPCFAIHGSGTRRKSAHHLAQEFLNADRHSLWSIVTNGRHLRLLRDAETLTRPNFLEFDLETILREGEDRYADFSALWRLLHASRAGSSGQPPADCIWEKWKTEGHAQGLRVRDGLRSGVEQALLILGSGFLSHPTNIALRQCLHDGSLTKEDYFQQLLRLIYRCLFLFCAEERGLLHTPAPADPVAAAAHTVARQAYAQGYSQRRLRNRCLRQSAHDRYSDLWQCQTLVFRFLATGQSRLALPALGGLFAEKQCPDLDGAALANRDFLAAMRHLRWSNASGSLTAIDYRNMGPEELGSVYESLLELIPTVDLPACRFGFVGITDDGSTSGNARKTTGSYYTPDSLVQELIKSALDPVIARAVAGHPDNPTQALLSLAVIDPACGSGHFLIAAARRLAEKLAEFRAPDGAVRPDDYRHALREVIARCIYGVDRNPMALELARTALWLEGYEPGQPLSFLDHHLVCGDSLLGLTHLDQLRRGISPAAFKALTGDDKDTCKTLAALNREGLKALEKRLSNTEAELFDAAQLDHTLQRLIELEALPDHTPQEVEAKAAAYTAFLKEAQDSPLAHACDLLVAAYLTPKTPETAAICPTTSTIVDVLFPRLDAQSHQEVLKHATRVCREARVFHWPLAFAHIFGRGGFDCVLGNPPWERIKLQEQEFFASRHPEIATAPNAAARQRLIAALAAGSEADQRLFREFNEAKRTAEAASMFAHVSGDEGGRFPLTGVGDVNTYALFAETIAKVTHRDGRAGFIVPTGIATDDSTKAFFADLAQNGQLASLYDYENREGLFPGVHRSFKFCLITLGPADAAEFAFFLTQPEQLHSDEGRARRFTLTREDFRLINPNTRTCPVFRSQADAELTKKIYRRVPVLIAEARDDAPEQNPWGITFSTMFHMSNDSGLFLNERTPTSLPLYEAKMVHQFDHRWATYCWTATGRTLETADVTDAQKARPDFVVQPRYWIEERHVLSRLARVPRCVTQAWDAQDEDQLRHAFACWLLAGTTDDLLAELQGATSSPRERVRDLGGRHFANLPNSERDWLNAKAVAEARNWPPLDNDELALLRDAPDLLTAAHHILDRRSPRWLMGWRDITNATNERTVIASVVPRVAVGHTLPLFFTSQSPRLAAALLANWSALCLDYVARQKIGGTHLTYSYLKQFPILPPTAYSDADLDYVVPRVLELTYTAHDLAPWAADLGYTGRPFTFDPERRAQLRAELDAYYARLYGLTRDELRFILDPADTHGPDYPTVTFPGLKRNELAAFNRYRTRDFALAAWDALANRGARPVEVTTPRPFLVPAPDWMDRPLVLPALPRGGPLDPAVYRAAMVPHLVYQAGGKIRFEQFRRAYWLLTEPQTLLRYAKGEIGREANKWARDFHDRLEKDQFIPHLRNAVRHDLQFVTLDGERWLQLRRTDHLSEDDHVIFDARLALMVADLWPSDEALAPLTREEEAVIKELEHVT